VARKRGGTGGREDWKTLTQTQVTEIYSLCALGDRQEGYRVAGPSEAPSFFPTDLLSKTHNIIFLASNTSSGTVVVVANLRRYDLQAATIDQQPFGVIYDPNTPSKVASGMWLHHAPYAGSRILMPQPVMDALLSSSIPSKFPLADDPPGLSGPLSDLANTGHEGAFKFFLKRLT
jgi:hypothetical protein